MGNAEPVHELIARPAHPDQILAGTIDGRLILWSISGNRELATLPVSPSRSGPAVLIDPTGTTMTVLTAAGTIERRDIDSGDLHGPPTVAPNTDSLIGFTADGYLLTQRSTVGVGESAIDLWNLDAGEKSGTLDSPEGLYGGRRRPINLDNGRTLRQIPRVSGRPHPSTSPPSSGSTRFATERRIGLPMSRQKPSLQVCRSQPPALESASLPLRWPQRACRYVISWPWSTRSCPKDDAAAVGRGPALEADQAAAPAATRAEGPGRGRPRVERAGRAGGQRVRPAHRLPLARSPQLGCGSGYTTSRRLRILAAGRRVGPAAPTCPERALRGAVDRPVPRLFLSAG